MFNDFIVLAASNLDNETDHIYTFHVSEQLDLDLAVTFGTNRILSMSSRYSKAYYSSSILK